MAQDRRTLLSRRVTCGHFPTIRESVRDLNPSYFALVMATGVLSAGLRMHDAPIASAVLLWIAVLGYLLLVSTHVWRLIAFRTRMRADLADPARGFGFFTFVAGTDVLGTRFALGGHTIAATGLLVTAGISWLVLGYLVPSTAALGRSGGPPAAAANGTWFVWVVASQSIAVLAAVLHPVANTGPPALLAVLLWSVGIFLYGIVGVLVLVRLALYELRPADLGPPYWVAMGATAITVLSSAEILQLGGTPITDATREFIAGAAVLFWAFGTWLIPVLLAAGWWRHITHRVPLRYEAAWWSIVFPLAMYSVATRALGEAEHLEFMVVIGENALWLALATWVIAFSALLWRLGGILLAGLRADTAEPSASG